MRSTEYRLPRMSWFDLAVEATVLAVAVFLIAPLVMVILNSIGTTQLATFPPDSLALTAYTSIPAKWLTALTNSIIVAALATAIACVIGTSAAFGLSRTSIRYTGLIDSLFRSPLIVPSLVIGVAFLQYYSWLSIDVHIPIKGTIAALVIAHSAVSLPFVFAIVLARLATLDVQLEEAAYGLGASPLRTFARVTLPVLGPAIFSGAFFAFLMSFDNVPLSLFLVGPGTRLFPVELFTSIEFDVTRTVYAVATLVCLGTILVLIFTYRRLTAVVAASYG